LFSLKFKANEAAAGPEPPPAQEQPELPARLFSANRYEAPGKILNK